MGGSKLEIHMFPCLDDNYGYLLHDGLMAAPDPVPPEHIDANPQPR